MKETITREFNKTQKYTRKLGKSARLYGEMYEALLNGKKVLYITNSPLIIIKNKFKDLFNVNIKCTRESKISVKLKLINNESKND